MIKVLAPDVWVFDCEWTPDPATGRAVYGLPEHADDATVLLRMWDEAGATAEQPRPYLKTALCRVVSIAAVKRIERNGAVCLRLVSIPELGDPAIAEHQLIERFLRAVGEVKPQLVGYNSASADIPALVQRALVHRVTVPKFCARPDKPWEGVDYFTKYSDWNVDLKDLVACHGYGKSTPSLHEIAAACRIPAKGGVGGADVIDLWRAGQIDAIVRYNQRDALTTYLLWLRIAHLAGKVTTAQFEAEEKLLAENLTQWATHGGGEHLRAFLEEWRGPVAAGVPS